MSHFEGNGKDRSDTFWCIHHQGEIGTSAWVWARTADGRLVVQTRASEIREELGVAICFKCVSSIPIETTIRLLGLDRESDLQPSILVKKRITIMHTVTRSERSR